MLEASPVVTPNDRALLLRHWLHSSPRPCFFDPAETGWQPPRDPVREDSFSSFETGGSSTLISSAMIETTTSNWTSVKAQ
ncbi:MAG: hypothetical protein IID39_00495 [Planctomycetes bacterium]|nr:hypothetical protein [Planctomycetota bacterium]